MQKGDSIDAQTDRFQAYCKVKGRTVTFLGRAQIPPKDRDCTENMVVERKDGSLWMLVRTVFAIYTNAGFSGSNTKRPELQRLPMDKDSE